METKQIKDILAMVKSMTPYLIGTTTFEVEICKFIGEDECVPSGFYADEAAYFQVNAEGIEGTRMIFRDRLEGWLETNAVRLTTLMTKDAATVYVVIEIDKQTFMKHSISFQV